MTNDQIAQRLFWIYSQARAPLPWTPDREQQLEDYYDQVKNVLALVDQLRSERDEAMKRAAQAEAKQLELIRMETEQYDRAYKLEAALARLRTALEFYAGLGMAELHSGDREPGEFIQDLGATARAALASTRPDASWTKEELRNALLAYDKQYGLYQENEYEGFAFWRYLETGDNLSSSEEFNDWARAVQELPFTDPGNPNHNPPTGPAKPPK